MDEKEQGSTEAGERLVLLVEDQENSRRLYEDILEEEGFLVIGAGNGREALELFESRRPAVVVTDVKMPHMDGETLFAKVMALAPTTKVIIITAQATIEAATRLLKLGAVDYLQKPFSPGRLVQIVRKAFEELSGREELGQVEQQQWKARVESEFKRQLDFQRWFARKREKALKEREELLETVQKRIEAVEAELGDVRKSRDELTSSMTEERVKLSEALTGKDEALSLAQRELGDFQKRLGDLHSESVIDLTQPSQSANSNGGDAAAFEAQQETIRQQADSIVHEQAQRRRVEEELESVRNLRSQMDATARSLVEDHEQEIELLKRMNCRLQEKVDAAVLVGKVDGIEPEGASARLLERLDERVQKVRRLEAALEKAEGQSRASEEKSCDLQARFDFVEKQRVGHEEQIAQMERLLAQEREKGRSAGELAAQLDEARRDRENLARKVEMLEDDATSTGRELKDLTKEPVRLAVSLEEGEREREILISTTESLRRKLASFEAEAVQLRAECEKERADGKELSQLVELMKGQMYAVEGEAPVTGPRGSDDIQAEQLFRVLQSLPLATIVIAADGKLAWIAHSARKLLGLPMDTQLVGATLEGRLASVASMVKLLAASGEELVRDKVHPGGQGGLSECFATCLQVSGQGFTLVGYIDRSWETETLHRLEYARVATNFAEVAAQRFGDIKEALGSVRILADLIRSMPKLDEDVNELGGQIVGELDGVVRLIDEVDAALRSTEHGGESDDR